MNDIHKAYNTYAEGGYMDWISEVRKWRPGISEDIDAKEPTYDYEGFFMEDPERAWRMLDGDPEAHFIDKYKKPNHPTFSDESIYSTPETPGGHWHENYGGSERWVYEPSKYTKKNIDRTREYLENSGEGYLEGMNAVFPNRKNKFDGYSQPTQQMNKVNYYNPITGQNYGDVQPENTVRVTNFNQLTPEAQDEYQRRRETILPELTVVPKTSPSIGNVLRGGYDNFEDTFGISGKEAAGFVPYVGDALDFYDIGNDLNEGNYLAAGLGIGALFLPNIIEKPLKAVYRRGKNLVRNFNKVRHYDASRARATYNSYMDKSEDIIEGYIRKYGDVQGGTAKDRARGLREALADRDEQIKKLYLKDEEFASFINAGNMQEYFDEAPEYAYFCFKEGLDPSLKTTANKFVRRQETSVRGVHSLSPEEAEKAVTVGYRTRPSTQRGGDQITSRGGLYTSNSGSLGSNTTVNVKGQKVEKVGNRFTTPLDRGGEGDLFLLHTDFGVDMDAAPLEQIRQFKNRSIDYDVVNADRIEKVVTPPTSRLNLKKKSLFDDSDFDRSIVGDWVYKPERKTGYTIKMSDPNILAIQHPYFDPSVFERVLVTSKPEAKLADIVDKSHIVTTGPRTDRFSGVPMDYSDNLFLPYAPSNDFRTMLHYSRIREAGTPKVHNDFTLKAQESMFNRANKYKELAEKRAAAA